MGKVTAINFISLDGVMQAPARTDEDTRGGFTQGGWPLPYQDEVMGRHMGEMMAKSQGSLLLGRRTYEDFYSVWPKRANNPTPDHLNKVTKYVASRTLKEPLPWQNSVLLQGDAADAVAELNKQGDTNLAILGSGNLTHSLIRKKLIDEYLLVIFPITLGIGLRLFPDGSSLRLKLVDSLTTPKGVIIATYQAE
jgi:dihydrofolate reductase